MPEVKLVRLSKLYGKVTAVDDISLVIQDKEYVTILGPSGCGKTTLIRMIAGIIEPTKGEVVIGERSMKGVPIEDRDIGYVFQNIALFPNMTVRENVSYSLRVKGAPLEEQDSTSHRFLELVKLLERMEMLPDELCGGEQQKVSLARALATGSKLLLLDEPLSALDARVRVDLRYELRRLAKSLGLTVVHVTHDQEEAMSVSDRIVLMRAGAVVEVGTPEQLYSRPKKIFTANFIGETNLIEGWVRSRSDEGSQLELRDGSMMDVANCSFEVGEAVAVSIRPEFVFPFTSGLKAIVRSVIYMGNYWRLMAETVSEDEVEFDVPVADGPLYQVGQEVYLMVNRKAAVVFPRPREGIEEAIRLE